MTVSTATELTAAGLVEKMRSRGVRVHRYREPPRVVALTTDAATAEWLRNHGAVRAQWTEPDGSYSRDRVTKLREFDFDLHMVTVREHFVEDEETGELVRDAVVGATAIWEAAVLPPTGRAEI